MSPLPSHPTPRRAAVLGLAVALAGLACDTPSVEAREARIWDDAHNRGLWSHGRDRAELAARVRRPHPRDRGRVRLEAGNVRADNGEPLRGELLRVSSLGFGLSPFHRLPVAWPRWRPFRLARESDLERAYRTDVWRELAERHHLNTVRLLLYRPPLFGEAGLGADCPRERCFARVDEALPHLDAMVEIASELGFYVLIDYHPVGGVLEEDLFTWWDAIAPRYADRSHVMYELCNEPVRGTASDYGAAALSLQERIYRRVRAHAPDTHLVLFSFQAPRGGVIEAVEGVAGVDWTRTSVGYHPYGHDAAQLRALAARGHALFNTEIGAHDRETFAARTHEAEAVGESWVWLDGSGAGKWWALWNPLPITWARDPRTLPARD